MSRLKGIAVSFVGGVIYCFPLSIAAEQVPWFIYIPVWLVGCIFLGVCIGKMQTEMNHYKD